MTVTADGWIEVTVTVDGWTEDLDGLGEEVGMEAGGFNPILSLLAIFVILHHLHDSVVVLGVAVEEGIAIATTLECVFCLGKWVIVGRKLSMNGSRTS